MHWSKEERMREVRLSIRQLPSWLGTLEKGWMWIRNEEHQMRYAFRGERAHKSFRERALRRELSLLDALGLGFCTLLMGILYPFSDRRSGVGCLFICLGAGVLISSFGDDRLWIASIIGLLGYRHPVLALLLLMQLCMPLWCFICAVPALISKRNFFYSWIWACCICLAFFMLST